MNALTNALTTTNKFNIHPEFIISTIKDQAQGIAKAVVELVMNSIDAGASGVWFEILENDPVHQRFKFSITDNGKGMTEKDISTYFANFGVPHEDGDAVYGKFRIGRGQCFSISKTEWHSLDNLLQVDLIDALEGRDLEGINFKFTKADNYFKGCKVVIDVYSQYYGETGTLFDELGQYLRYAPVDIYLDDYIWIQRLSDQLKALPDEMAYVETKDAYFLYSKNSDFTIYNDIDFYNIGIHIPHQDYSASVFKGVIISKKPFVVTTSRNEVITNRCPLWSKITKQLLKVEKEYIDFTLIQNLHVQTSRIGENVAELMLVNHLIGKHSYPDLLLNSIDELQLFTDYKGYYYSINDLKQSNFKALIIYDRFSHDITVMERIEKNLNALVLKSEGLIAQLTYEYRNFQNSKGREVMPFDAAEFYTLKKLSRYLNKKGMSTKAILYSDVAKNYTEEYTTLAKHSVPKSYLEKLHVINEYVSEIMLKEHGIAKRELHIGRAKYARAWTDGKNTITFNESTIKSMFKNEEYLMIINIIVHEYCHLTAHDVSHDIEFYTNFHDLVMYQNLMPLLKKLI